MIDIDVIITEWVKDEEFFSAILARAADSTIFLVTPTLSPSSAYQLRLHFDSGLAKGIQFKNPDVSPPTSFFFLSIVSGWGHSDTAPVRGPTAFPAARVLLTIPLDVVDIAYFEFH